MGEQMPDTVLDQRYSDDRATAVAWEEAREELANAGVYWLSTVRPDGHPHVTPLIGVWLDGALLFCTGPQERKARNLAANPDVAVTTGTNALHAGLDVVVEGSAGVVRDEAELTRAAQAWVSKYGEEWRFEVRDGAFHHASGSGVADVYRVAPTVVFAFGKAPYSQTRYTWSPHPTTTG